MTNVYFLNLSFSHTGLCNQINSLLSSICECIGSEKIIVVNKFLKEINTNNYCPIADIINLEKINIFLQKYNTAILDGNFTNNLNIISATYGNDINYINVTDKIRQFIHNNSFFISKSIDINKLFSNYTNNTYNNFLKINFIINNHNKFTMKFYTNNKAPRRDININFLNKNYIHNTSWELIDSAKYINITNDIYKNLCFTDIFYLKSDMFIKNINISQVDKVNIIHIRVEQDAIDFWGKNNKVDFINKLIKFYIDAIKELINKEDKTIILTYELNNCIVEYLRNNNYNFYYHEKHKNNDRECNAIIDFINGTHCNNVFIGVGGSTFSHTLTKIISPKIFRMVDINNI